ncbi:uncharacterized protein [Argopecten irradians]|uniref:uncharacterized protein n=1 Tax=Argopecten irradians TaxID=31199 RepID=UPI0037204923
MDIAALKQELGDTLLTKEGEVPIEKALEGKKTICLYFSAHWCPPCRQFTPAMADVYSNGEKGDDVEVIFISSDRDEASFKEYFGEMPWIALPFSVRDKKAALSEKHGIRGIPTLVVLKSDGSVDTNGRAHVMQKNSLKHQMDAATLKCYFGDNILIKGGEVPTEIALEGKNTLCFYFSAHWCPPCREFTPVLSKIYNQGEKGADVEVVFISMDRDYKSFEEYFAEMPWCALPFRNRDIKATLSQRFGIEGIPSLVILKKDGSVNKAGKSHVMEHYNLKFD